MDPTRAQEIVERWSGSTKDGDEDHRRLLQGELVSLLSEDAEAGHAFIHGRSVVLAVDGDRFIRFSAGEESIGQNKSAFQVRTVTQHLTPGANLTVVTRYEGDNLRYRRRIWSLESDEGDRLQIETFVSVSPGSVYEGGDAVMRAVATRLGWPIPDA